LLTCRRAWLEANALPMRQAEHLFWSDGYTNYKKADMAADIWWTDFGSRLTPLNIANVRSVHFVLPIYRLGSVFAQGNSLRQVMKLLKPKTFKITNTWWPGINSRSPRDTTPLHQRQFMRKLASLLDACSCHVEKFQLTLDIQDSEASIKDHAAFFDALQCFEKRIGIFKSPDSEVYFESYFRVIDAPRASKRTRKPYPPNDQYPVYTLDFHVHELEWVRVHRAVDPLTGGHFGIPDDPAANNPFLPRRFRRKPHGRVYNKDLSPLLCQQDRLRQHSQKLSGAFAAQWRKTFNKLREEAEIGVELERICAQGSLLRIGP
jgi:hypothetical protein